MTTCLQCYILLNTYSMKPMFYYILDIKMTSQSLSSFCIELQASGFVKFDNDSDVILMFEM